MRHAYNAQANVVAALALELAGDLRAAVEEDTAGGLSGAAALVALDGLAPGASIDGLARICGLSHSGAVRLADRLGEAGLVERRPAADGRAVSLRLTASGRRRARRILARREAAVEAVLAPLGPSDRAELARIAGVLLAARAAEGQSGDRICRLCDASVCGRPGRDCPVVAGGEGAKK